MYLYFTLFLLIFVLAVFKWKPKTEQYLFVLVAVLMTAMLCFRSGQGTDYYPYEYIFQNTGSLQSVIDNALNSHTEVGFSLLCVLFPWGFRVFVFVISLYEMIMLYRFIGRYSDNKLFSLLLFFPTFYLTYYFSAFRQGIVIATLLGVGVALIEKKKWVRFVVMCLILSTIHYVALFLLIIPLLANIKLKTLVAVFLPVALLLGFLLSTGISVRLVSYIPLVGARFAGYLSDTGFSFFSFAERTVTLFFVLYLYQRNRSAEEDPWWMKAYVLGHVMYAFMILHPLVGIRLLMCFKVLEIMIVPNLLRKEPKSMVKVLVIAYFFAMPVVMYVHNVNSYIEQGDYIESVNCINYPYVHIFDSDKLWQYRGPSFYYGLLD